MQEKRYSLTEVKELLRQQRVLCDENLDYEIHGSQVEIFHDNVINAPEPPLPLPSEEVKPIGSDELKGKYIQHFEKEYENLKNAVLLYEAFEWFMENTTPQPVISEEEMRKIGDELVIKNIRRMYFEETDSKYFDNEMIMNHHLDAWTIAMQSVSDFYNVLKSKLNGEEEAK